MVAVNRIAGHLEPDDDSREVESLSEWSERLGVSTDELARAVLDYVRETNDKARRGDVKARIELTRELVPALLKLVERSIGIG
ncbi:MAG: hypothetical protein HS116_18975 [Planctomycetes bacterium]|nr:hypothetical protein [Planctomycetota bacterium]